MEILGDVDSDGHDDFCVGAPGDLNRYGRVSAYSGRTGGLLWATPGTVQWALFGKAIAAVGDADGDGIGDVFVGARDDLPYGMFYQAGSVHLLSGSDGHVVWSAAWPGLFRNLGDRCAAVGDINGDGYPDCWAATSTSSTALILSGRDGSLLRQHFQTGSRNLWTACMVPDRDGDGADDYCVGSPLERLYPNDFGSITIYSGRSGQSLLYQQGTPVTALQGNTAFGLSVACFGDMDDDGFDDIVVGNPEWDFAYGSNANIGITQVISGANGQILWWRGDIALGRLHGWQVAAAGDLTGDGEGDFAVFSNIFYPMQTFGSGIEIIDGRNGQLVMTGYSSTIPMSVIALGGDLDGDRVPDIVFGMAGSNPGPYPNGLATAARLGFAGVRPLVRTHSVGCPTSSSMLPRIRYRKLPKLGSTFTVEGRALPAQQVCMLGLGPPQLLDLAPLGAPGCRAYVVPLVQCWAGTSSYGHVRFDFALPVTPVLQGLSLTAQWLAVDPAANALGVVLSDALNVELQL